jgi:uncharacterized protein YdiU (UPF0061 family)
MSALGLTIDYGPYGWLEPYDPDWTPNTTDAQGRRYRFGGQPAIAQWNLARLCEAFVPLVGAAAAPGAAPPAIEERLLESLRLYKDEFERAYARVLADKLGLRELAGEADQALAARLFALLGAAETDYTIFFRALSGWRTNTPPADFVKTIEPAFYAPDAVAAELREGWRAWADAYSARLRQDGRPDAERSALMQRMNPKYVLRNYLAQLAIDAAAQGDASVLERLMRVLERPYDEQPEAEDLAARRPEWARSKPGCSALSCSS